MSRVWLFWDSMDCSLPGSSVHGIFQARILESVAISYSRESSWPRYRTCVPGINRQILYHRATREAPASTYPLANSIIRRCGSPFFALQTTWLYQSQERKLCGNEVWYLIPQKPTLSTAESSPNFWYIHSFFSILTLLSLSFLLSLYY